MIAATISPRAGLAAAMTALLVLGACAEPERILPGPREDLRAADETPLLRENMSRPIRLPAAAVNADWPQSAGGQIARPAHPALGADPQLLWSADIGEGDGRRVRITADPVTGGGLIYTLDSGAQVSGVTGDGAVAWRTDLTPPADRQGEATGGGLAWDDGTLYVALGYGTLAALDAATGALRWRQDLDATGSGAPTVRDGLVYVVAGDDTGWAIETETGRIAWQIQANPSVANVLGAPAPALAGDLVVFAFGSGDLIATFRRGGLRRWAASVAGRRKGSAVARIDDVTGGPVVADGRIYAGNQAGRLVALDAQSGERIWTAREGTAGPVWPAGDSVFAITDRSRLMRFDARDGSPVWAVDLPGFVRDKPRRRAEIVAHYGPVLAGGRLIVASNDGLIRFFAPEDGRLTGTLEIPGGATSAPVVAGGTLYVVGSRGDLYAFR